MRLVITRINKTTIIVSILAILIGACGPFDAHLATVDYNPRSNSEGEIATLAEQGMDPLLVAELYDNAAELETLYSLLVVKNGYLIAKGPGRGNPALGVAAGTSLRHRDETRTRVGGWNPVQDTTRGARGELH